MMTGYSGTSRNGNMYRYYACNNARKKACNKKNVGKEYIENLVVDKCRELLTDENIELIAKEVVKVSDRDREHSNINRLEKLLIENDKAVANLMKALEVGEVADLITARIKKKQQERADIEKQLAIEEKTLVKLTVPQVKFFLTQIRDGDANDPKYRKTLVTVLVNAIYLYDDKITLILNVGDNPVEITETLLDEIENAANVRALNTTDNQTMLSRTD